MSDPMADIYNMTGAQGMFNPNPYLEFTGQIPMAGFAGSPVNAATGQPIQTPGTTLNSQPQSAPAAAPQTNPGYAYQMAMLNAMGRAAMQPNSGPTNNQGQTSGGGGGMSMSDIIDLRSQLNQAYGMPASSTGVGALPQQSAPAPAAAQPSGAANSRQAYLQAMANPGPLPQYGAQMQPGAQPTGAPQPSVLAAFLAAHPQGGQTGAGGYSNKPFFNTLAQLQSQGAAGT